MEPLLVLGADAGIREAGVDAPVTLDHRCHGLFDLFLVGDVALQRAGGGVDLLQLRLSSGVLVRICAPDADVGTRSSDASGVPEADAAVASRDDCDFAAQVKAVVLVGHGRLSRP